jgi:hypothetical protein
MFLSEQEARRKIYISFYLAKLLFIYWRGFREVMEALLILGIIVLFLGSIKLLKMYDERNKDD